MWSGQLCKGLRHLDPQPKVLQARSILELEDTGRTGSACTKMRKPWSYVLYSTLLLGGPPFAVGLLVVAHWRVAGKQLLNELLEM